MPRQAPVLNNVTVIIPYYQTPESLSRLLGNLNDAVQVIVVSNCQEQRPLHLSRNVQWLDMPFNSGFSAAANRGADKAKTEWLFFANADLALTPELLDLLVTEAGNRNLDALSPRLVDHQLVDQAGYHAPFLSPAAIIWEYSPLRRMGSFPFQRQTVLPGGALLIKRSGYQDLQGWDERLWLWWEDVDLSQRLLQKGFALGTSTQIKVEHIGGESFSPLAAQWKKAVFFQSLKIMTKKHWPQLGIVWSILLGRFACAVLYPVDDQLDASVVVPNMRKELLESFLADNIDYFDFSRHEVIIVSSAPDLMDLRIQYPQVIFVALEKNDGFAATVNIGFRRARGKFVGTINDDVQLPKNWIEILKGFPGKRVGSVMPHVVTPNGDTESYGVSVSPQGKALANTDETLHPQTVNAAAVFFSREALEEVGLFDERFGSYLEDVDLGLRMGAAGFTHVVMPAISVIHKRHQTSKRIPVKKAWLDCKNWWLIVLKPYWRTYWLRNGVGILIERLRNLNGLVKAWKTN